MNYLSSTLRCILAGMAILATASCSMAAATLTADTSRPESSTYAAGEQVSATFAASGLTGMRMLQIKVADEQARTVYSTTLSVRPDASGNWQRSINLPSIRLGFYRVNAWLSSGETLAPLGSRDGGYLTYCVVPDPATRVTPSEDTARFGMQGGFSSKVPILPYLGVRWVGGGYKWKDMEPSSSGQFVANWQAAQAHAQRFPALSSLESITYKSQPWAVFTMPNLYFSPSWSVIPGTLAGTAGALSPSGEVAWQNYCTAVAENYSANYPNRLHHVYEITWEPAYPWGFGGTNAQLIRIHQIAYAALHSADPKAVVLGPTWYNLLPDGVAAHDPLFSLGLTNSIDAISIHPYYSASAAGYPRMPEPGLANDYRALSALTSQYSQFPKPVYGTEQGFATLGKADELDQARSLVRENLIMLGEGAQVNWAFYIADFSNANGGWLGGYGYYYNLNPNIPYGTDKIGPKPVAPAYAAQSFLIDGYTSAAPMTGLGATGVGYAFHKTASTVYAVWDYGTTARSVSIPYHGINLKAYDWMGNSIAVTTSNGSVTVTLGPEPVYLQFN